MRKHGFLHKKSETAAQTACVLERGPTKVVPGTRRLSAINRNIASIVVILKIGALNTCLNLQMKARLHNITLVQRKEALKLHVTFLFCSV